jgi:hypothetical protein
MNHPRRRPSSAKSCSSAARVEAYEGEVDRIFALFEEYFGEEVELLQEHDTQALALAPPEVELKVVPRVSSGSASVPSSPRDRVHAKHLGI